MIQFITILTVLYVTYTESINFDKGMVKFAKPSPSSGNIKKMDLRIVKNRMVLKRFNKNLNLNKKVILDDTANIYSRTGDAGASSTLTQIPTSTTINDTKNNVITATQTNITTPTTILTSTPTPTTLSSLTIPSDVITVNDTSDPSLNGGWGPSLILKEPSRAPNFKIGYVLGKVIQLRWNFTYNVPLYKSNDASGKNLTKIYEVPRFVNIYARRQPPNSQVIIYPIVNKLPGNILHYEWDTAEYQKRSNAYTSDKFNEDIDFNNNNNNNGTVPRLVNAYDYTLVIEDASFNSDGSLVPLNNNSTTTNNTIPFNNQTGLNTTAYTTRPVPTTTFPFFVYFANVLEDEKCGEACKLLAQASNGSFFKPDIRLVFVAFGLLLFF